MGEFRVAITRTVINLWFLQVDNLTSTVIQYY